MLNTLAVSGYRSLRSLVVPLGRLNLVTGANGSGKSSVYRALRLLAETAQGGVVAALSREGGLDSTLWCGPENISRAMKRGEHPVQGGPRQEPVSLRMGFAGEELSYAIDLGLPIPQRPPSAFFRDPEIKGECIWNGPLLRASALLVDRRNAAVRVRGDDGKWETVAQHLPNYDSMLAQLADPQRAPEVLLLREQVRSWRFYDHFRTDAEAPARLPQVGTRTPALHHDGRDLAAALQTIREIGDDGALDEAIADAFPGSRLDIRHGDGRFAVELHQHGLLRALSAAELSDGTLRYLLWIAALLTPRPPRLMVLNEPETSLHPDLLPALARLIGVAVKSTQVWVVSHSARLISALEQNPDCQSLMLEKELGETRVAGLRELDVPAWNWPQR
jgi:predicted ATPase